MSRPLQMQFLTATEDVAGLPATRAEVTLIGRSNVGKSSLLNAIAGTKNMSHVSKTPGRTQTLTCFAIDGTDVSLVDCPGYGYAKVPKSKRAQWLPMLESYLLLREQLAMVMLLVDGEIGPTASDLEMLEWLRFRDLPHTVVATKYDKVRPSKRDRRQREFAASCQLERAEVPWVSIHDNFGITGLRELIREWLS